MFTKTVVDPIYVADVTFCIGDFDEYKTYLRQRTGHDTNERAPQARVTLWERDDGITEWFFWVPTWPKPLTRRHLTSVIHETRHLSDQILRSRGLRWAEESEEAFAYHQGYWFNVAMDEIEGHVEEGTVDASNDIARA